MRYLPTVFKYYFEKKVDFPSSKWKKKIIEFFIKCNIIVYLTSLNWKLSKLMEMCQIQSLFLRNKN